MLDAIGGQLVDGEHKVGGPRWREPGLGCEPADHASYLDQVEGAKRQFVRVHVTDGSAIVELVPWHWQAALVWAVAYALVAGGLAFYGKSRLSVRMPSRTIESLEENRNGRFIS